MDWIGKNNYNALRAEQEESAGQEEKIIKQLETQEKEMNKQKERMKFLTNLVEEQGELLKLIAESKGIRLQEGEEEGNSA